MANWMMDMDRPFEVLMLWCCLIMICKGVWLWFVKEFDCWNDLWLWERSMGRLRCTNGERIGHQLGMKFVALCLACRRHAKWVEIGEWLDLVSQGRANCMYIVLSCYDGWHCYIWICYAYLLMNCLLDKYVACITLLASPWVEICRTHH